MPLSRDRHTENQKSKTQAALKRFGILAGFAVLLILLAGAAIVLRRQLLFQVANQDRVTHTRLVLSELKTTELLLKDAEIGQRGFLYTGDPKYLEPFDLAIAQVEAHIDSLAQLTADNPRQQARIPVLRSLLQTKLAELGQTISLYSSSRRDEAEALVLSDVGLLSVRRIDGLIADMEQEETTLESSQTVTLRRLIRVTIAFVYLASILGGLSLAALAYFILFEMNFREKYLQEIWRREESFRVTVDSIGDAVICTDPHGIVTLLNRVGEKLTGWSQREANGRFGFSAKTTLSLAQALYEKHKVLTYPRTDSRALPEDYISTVKTTLGMLQETSYGAFAAQILKSDWVKPNKRIFNNAKLSDHFAIIPTALAPKHLSEHEQKLYDLVTRRFLAIFYPAAEFLVSTRITRVKEEAFKTEGKVRVNAGWMNVYGREAQGQDQGQCSTVADAIRVAREIE